MILIDYDAVMRCIGVADLIEPLRRAFAGVTLTPERHHHEIGTDGRRTLLLMPAWRAQGALGVKVSTVFNDNPSRGLPAITGLYLLLSAETGSVAAIIDGRALTLLRTAAVSALAAELLAPPDAESLLLVGTGALARFMIEGHTSVRAYRRISVWGRNAGKAEGVVSQLQAAGIRAVSVSDLETAVRTSDVISCATFASEPLIHGGWLKPRAHLDLVGSYKASMREADDECFRGASVFVDTLDALRESGDLSGPLGRRVLEAAQIQTLSQVLSASGPHGGRSVFKSVGTGLADLAAAEMLLSVFRNDRSYAGQDLPTARSI